MKTNQVLKSLLFLAGFALLFTSCDKEVGIEQHQHPTSKNPDIHIETISFDEFANEGSSKELAQKLVDQKNGAVLSNKNGEKKGIQIMNGLVVLTDSIKKIVGKQTVTWTFDIAENNIENSVFENFLIKKSGETFSYFLISYQPDQDLGSEFNYLSYSYEIPKEYLELESLDITSKDDFDFAPPSGGGGCLGKVRYIIDACNRGGTHIPKYCCQHNGGIHGCGNGKPCSYTCTGTSISSIIFDFSHCGGSSVGGGTTFNNDDNDGLGSPSGSTAGESLDSGSTITTPLTYADGSSLVSNLINTLGYSYFSIEAVWLRTGENTDIAVQIVSLLEQENDSNNAIAFAREAIHFHIYNSQPLLINTTRAQLVEQINILTNVIETYGTMPYKELAIYLKTVNTILDDFNDAELYDYYTQVWDYRYNMQLNRLGTVALPFLTHLVFPVIEFALFEVGGTLAIKLLSRIPISFVLRGITLTPFIQNVARLGIQGTQPHVRIVKVTNPVGRARGLFNALTKNALSVTEVAPGVTQATMGNGNFITFRTVSKSGFPATINFNFQQLLGTNNFVVKFGL